MRQVLLTIVLIIIATSIYIGYKWVTFDHEGAKEDPKTEETVQKESNDEDDDNDSNQSDAMTYDEYWSNLLKDFNKRTHLLFNEENFHIVGFLHTTDLFSMHGENMETTVTGHVYRFDDQGESDSDSFTDNHDVKKDYALNEDIKGVITYDNSSRKFSFVQTNGKENEDPIRISSRESDSVEDLQEVLDSLEPPEEKQYSEKAFIDLIGIDPSDLLVFNLDDEAINLEGIDVFKYEGISELTIYYSIDIDEELVNASIKVRDASGLDIPGNPIELKNGRTIYLIDEENSAYAFAEDGYEYDVTFFDRKTNNLDEKAEILELLNVPLLDE